VTDSRPLGSHESLCAWYSSVLKRYREALAFYADSDNWKRGVVDIDEGDKARDALEEVEK
jgi:hypothetical protein